MQEGDGGGLEVMWKLIDLSARVQGNLEFEKKQQRLALPQTMEKMC
jgi:hypothetical protein